MNGFTIYREYFDLITLLSKREQSELLLAICNYMFNGEEPDLNDSQMKIFKNLKRPLDKSKKRGLSGSRNNSNENQNENEKNSKRNQNEIKIKSNSNQNENKTKTHQDVNVNVNGIVDNYFNNKNILKERFLEFLEIRKKLKAVNSERAVKLLLKDLENKNDIEQLAMIEKSIKNSWKGLYELKPDEKRRIAEVPEWFNKTLLKEETTPEEKRYLDELLKEFK